MQQPCELLRFPISDYQTIWAWQRQRARDCSAGLVPDALVLVQHPHTYTLGRLAKPEHLLVSPEQLAQQGIALVETDRGGDITYHGPGQLVCYPILKLSRYGGDVVAYLRSLETVIIRVLAHYGFVGQQIAGLTGVWVNDEKIAAIGVHFTASGVTLHGFALNVAPDLRLFEQIIPCGIRNKGVTSLERLLGVAPSVEEVELVVMREFSAVFEVLLQ